jgi:hypothetical protein
VTRLRHLLLLALVALTGCGSGDKADPVDQVPAKGGVREDVRAATSSSTAGFPAAGGRTLQEVADGLDGTGPDAVMASSVFTVGKNRLAFGAIDAESNAFVYGKTAVYVAPTPARRRRARSPPRPTCC